MKKLSIALGLGVACLMAGNALAVSAHYGDPKPGMSAGNGPSNYLEPLAVVNNTYQAYNVDLTQSDGSHDNLPIQSVADSPYNVISIDSSSGTPAPAWPVHVVVSGFDGTVYFNQMIYPDPMAQAPQVKRVMINNSTGNNAAGSQQSAPQITIQ